MSLSLSLDAAGRNGVATERAKKRVAAMAIRSCTTAFEGFTHLLPRLPILEDKFWR